MYCDVNVMPSLAALEPHWATVRRELDTLDLANFRAWPERQIYTNDGWKVFGFYAFGHRLEQNCERCPETVRLLEAMPGMVTAGFSRLAAGTRILPHCGYVGYSGYHLRAHLGIAVPREADCGLTVGGETRSWEEGKCLLFDDSSEHSAWNHGPGDRVVLLIDLHNPNHVPKDGRDCALSPDLLFELAPLLGIDPFG
ncbi:MAG TPA: aspartyl/asparaginyl beta-hydroxylase domain-containing protein [Stellaceae bacterium]|jgi:beta-hydroxylase|nr:aspartyl/asparaginyl beta-hydroxylase domain-containing protein [Stellaceae bacterium]